MHLWKLDLGRVLPADASLLSTDEQQRGQRFQIPGDASHFINVRATLRLILGSYLGCPPQQLAFRYGPHGKPRLAPPHEGIHFNLSHSADIALFAVSRMGPLGIDVERVRPQPVMDRIARRMFSTAHAQRLAQAPAQERAPLFFAEWTALEAGLKWSGQGIFERKTQGQPPPLHRFIPEPGYLAALACNPDPGPPSTWGLYLAKGGGQI